MNFRRILKKWTPSLFRDFSQRLLTNYPHLWVAKIPYALTFGAILLTTLYLSVFVYPVSLHNLTIPNKSISLILLAAIGISLWVYAMTRFNIHDDFGEISPIKDLQSIVIYYFILLAFVAIPCLYPVILSYRITHIVSNETLTKDIDTFNLGRKAYQAQPPIYEIKLPIQSEREHQTRWYNELTNAQQKSAFDASIPLIQKYGNPSFKLSLDTTWTKDWASKGLAFASSPDQSFHFHETYRQTQRNIKSLIKIKEKSLVDIAPPLPFILWLTGLFLIFLVLSLRLGWKLMLRTILLMLHIAGLIGILVQIPIIDNVFQSIDQILHICFLLICMGLMYTSYRIPHTKRAIRWKISIIASLCIMTTIVPVSVFVLSLGTSFHPVWITILLTIGTIVTLGSMPFYFLPRLYKLKAHPAFESA